VDEIKHKLLMAAEWRRKYPEVDVLEDFDEDVWNDWKKSCNEDVRNGGENSCNNYIIGMDAEMNVSLLSVIPHISLNSNSFVSPCRILLPRKSVGQSAQQRMAD